MKRSEIWIVNLDPTLGSEIQKARPAVIISRNGIGRFPIKVVIPITGWKDTYADAEWIVRLEPTPENGLSKASAADTLQIRAVAHQRFGRQIGKLSREDMKRLLRALAISVGMSLNAPYD